MILRLCAVLAFLLVSDGGKPSDHSHPRINASLTLTLHLDITLPIGPSRVVGFAFAPVGAARRTTSLFGLASPALKQKTVVKKGMASPGAVS